MSIKLDEVGGYEVSTVRTFAGGADDSKPFGSPFALSDYADENPWPFETMVFRPGSSRGLYHRAYQTLNEAEAGHAEIVQSIRTGAFVEGIGVRGDFGVPTLTPDEYQTSIAKTATPAR